MNDVIAIGGSYAGMAAALQLLRARRTFQILDSGLPRNRFAHHSHGFLTQDGTSRDLIADTAREQLLAYPTLTWTKAQAVKADGMIGSFSVHDGDGHVNQGRLLLLALAVITSIAD